MTRNRILLAVQLLGSLAILAWLPGNLAKLAAFATWWLITFRGLGRREALFWLCAIPFFTFMDAVSLGQGIFRFSNPDFLGMPAYEPLCWGFLILHAMRFVGGPRPTTGFAAGLGLTVAFALPFALIVDPTLLLVVSGLLLAAGLAIFHEGHDLAFVGYMIAVGCLWEFVGVFAGEWSYPGDPVGGVPAWFASMWGCVGLAARRLVYRLVAAETASAVAARAVKAPRASAAKEHAA